MKKFGKVFVFVLLLSFLLVGCDGLVQTTVRPLDTVSTELSIWEFYKKIEESYSTTKTDFLAVSDKSPILYKDLFDVYDNQKNVTRILRDGMAVLDLFYSAQTVAIFNYDNLHNYTVQKDESITRNGYRITYGENLDWHQVIGGDSVVDNLFAKLILPMQVETKISTNTAGGYTLDLTQKSTYPTNASEIEGLVPAETTLQGVTTKYVYSHITTSTYFNAQIEKQVSNGDEDWTTTYKRECRIEKTNNITFLTSKVTVNGVVSEKVYRLDQVIQGVTLGYSATNGKLDWIINYLGRGQLRIDGEAYFQGTNKFFIKEKYDLVTATPAPYSFKQSFTMEHNIDGATYKMKYYPGQIVYTPIAQMNVLKLGVYDNEIMALTLHKSLQVSSIQYYS